MINAHLHEYQGAMTGWPQYWTEDPQAPFHISSQGWHRRVAIPPSPCWALGRICPLGHLRGWGTYMDSSSLGVGLSVATSLAPGAAVPACGLQLERPMHGCIGPNSMHSCCRPRVRAARQQSWVCWETRIGRGESSGSTCWLREGTRRSEPAARETHPLVCMYAQIRVQQPTTVCAHKKRHKQVVGAPGWKW